MAELVTYGPESNTTLTFRDFAEYDVAMAIWRYISPCLILIGTIGSILSIFVLTRKKLRSVTTMFYLVLLACTDIIVLNTGLLRYWLYYSFDYGIRISSSFSCKFHTVMVYLSLDYSSWIVAMLSIDRCVSVCLPFRASKISSLRNARIISCVMFILLFSINMHYFWTYDLGEKTIFGMGTECYVAKQDYQEFIENVWPWIDFIVVCCIPFTIMITCNVLIVRQLIKSSKKLKSHKISTTSSVVIMNNQISLKSDQQQNNRNIPRCPRLTFTPKTDQCESETSESRGYISTESKKTNIDSTEKLTFAFKKNVESKNLTRVGPEENINFGTYRKTEPGTTETLGNGLTKNTRTNSEMNFGATGKPDPGTKNNVEKESEKNTGTESENNIGIIGKLYPEKKNNVENESATRDIGAELTKNIKRSRYTSESSTPMLKRDHSRLTAMQLSINCVFLILMLPITVYIIGYGTWKVSPQPYEEAVLMLMWAIVNMLQYTNNAIHFFLIYMTVPSFRRLFLSTCQRRTTINPENSVSLVAYK